MGETGKHGSDIKGGASRAIYIYPMLAYRWHDSMQGWSHHPNHPPLKPCYTTVHAMRSSIAGSNTEKMIVEKKRGRGRPSRSNKIKGEIENRTFCHSCFPSLPRPSLIPQSGVLRSFTDCANLIGPRGFNEAIGDRVSSAPASPAQFRPT